MADINKRQIRDIQELESEAQRGDITSTGGAATFGGPFRRDLTVELSPEQQALQDQITGAAGGAFGTGGTLDFGALAGINAPTRNLGRGLNKLTGERGRRRATQATFQRGLNLLQPGFEQERQRTEQNLAARGIPTGMGEAGQGGAFGRGSTQGQLVLGDLANRQGFARENLALSSVAAGGQEASRQLADELDKRGFQTGERAQRFDLGLRGRQQGINEQLVNAQFPLEQLQRQIAIGQSGRVDPILPSMANVNTAAAINREGQREQGPFSEGGIGRDFLTAGLDFARGRFGG